jgi:hypothetical protein
MQMRNLPVKRVDFHVIQPGLGISPIDQLWLHKLRQRNGAIGAGSVPMSANLDITTADSNPLAICILKMRN